MTPLLAEAIDWKQRFADPAFWTTNVGWLGLALFFVSLGVLVPPQVKRLKRTGIVLAAGAVVCLMVFVCRLHNESTEHLYASALFWTMAAVAIAGGVGLISSQSPVYSAVWFAFSLLGAAGIFLVQQAQFLGIATIIVYAGAIVVTFLFVLMLAQPEGHAIADRISWGFWAKAVSVAAATIFVGFMGLTVYRAAGGGVREQLVKKYPTLERELVAVEVGPLADGKKAVTLVFLGNERPLAAPTADLEHVLQPLAGSEEAKVEVKTRFKNDRQDVLDDGLPAGDDRHVDHMAAFGGYLFSRHLIALEVAGTLLLAALVGAVGMSLQGKYAREAAHE